MSPIAAIPSIYRLLAACIPSRGPNDYGMLATTALDGTACVRAVVLRGFDAATHQLWINTNVHTEKIKHVRQHPDAEVCLWLSAKKVQLRMRAAWRVIDAVQGARALALGELRQRSWIDQPLMSKHLYTADPTNEPPADFAVLLGTIYQIDALRITGKAYEQYLHRRTRTAWESQRVT